MFRSALTALAQLNVAGVNVNYDLEAVPEYLSPAQLPVLLVLPLDTDFGNTQRLFRDRGSGFETLAFSDGPRSVTYLVTHLLLVAPVAAGVGLRAHLPGLVDRIDAYFAALSITPTLGGELLEPARVRVEPGTFTYMEVRYYGCAFRHTWVVAL